MHKTSVFLILWLGIAAGIGSPVFGAEIAQNDAIRALIGEAANQGPDGMLAVACAIRNRGTLKGVYGLNNPIVDKQPAWVWKQAKRAWIKSASVDIVDGADHWESVRFKTPKWASKMTRTLRLKDHIFYRSKK